MPAKGYTAVTIGTDVADDLIDIRINERCTSQADVVRFLVQYYKQTSRLLSLMERKTESNKNHRLNPSYTMGTQSFPVSLSSVSA